MASAAPAHSRTAAKRWSLPDGRSLAWPMAAFALLLALHVDLALNRAVNWDEFYHYSQLQAFRAGTLVDPLQTLHARLFAWVGDFAGNAIDHLRLIRPIILLCVLATGGAIYAIAGRFADRRTAIACALMYLSAGFVLQHGASYRADGMVAACLAVSLALAARARLTLPVLFAIAGLCALGTLETLKTVLYAPAFLGLAWWRWAASGYDRKTALRLLAIPLLAAGWYAALYYWHAHSLGSGIEAAAAVDQSAVATVERSGRKMFSLGAIPYAHFIAKGALTAPVLAIAIAAAPILIARSERPASEKIALAGLWLPICVLGFYHNTAPYFYVFILAPVAAGCAPAASRLVERYSLQTVSLVLAAGALAVWTVDDRTIQARQSQVIDAADAIFGEPVAYFDFPAMLGGWPKANHFMTPWGQEAYLAGAAPSFRQIMERRAVPLVMEIDPLFTRLYASDRDVPGFLPADAAALRENYVRFWGPFRIAGRDLVGGQPRRTSEFLVPGIYTVVGGPIEFDGREYRAGSLVSVVRGRHAVAAAGKADARLIWGAGLSAPDASPPPPPFWADF